MQMFIIYVSNPNINKSAKIIITAETEEAAKEVFVGSFIFQSGMNKIISVTPIGAFYLLP